MESFWTGVKKYWQVILGFAAAIITVLAFRKQKDPAVLIENQQEAHDKELEAIKKSEKILKNKSQQAEYIYNKTLEEIEKKHSESSDALTSDMKRQMKKIVEENENDPDTITQRLSELTGFVIHVDEE